MNSDEFDKLTEMRKEWVAANQKNRFEKGLESLLSKMYPGKAHFIYELLQNSEDAGATCVKFGLSDSALAYEHNGPKLFSFSDVEAITGIGISTKQDDHTQIGKFGVGFKAVYDYTDSPEIHSNGYNFKIESMVIPTTESVKEVTDTTKTIFKFPFNTEKKDKATSMKEIAAGLNALDGRTLLFLKNITKIEFKFTDKCLNQLQSAYGEALFGNQTGVIERIQLSDNLVRIKTTNTVGKIRESDWLIFSEMKQIETSDKRTINCPIGIAFATGQNQEGQKVIIPCEPGQVFVYFPAEKETSNLKFHIHAPFSSTVARDSIHDNPDNEILKNALVELFTKSIPKIRELGLLNTSFLKILPNSGTNLSSFYAEFRDQIREAFILKPYVPCLDGTHECARFVLRGPIRLSKCFSNDDIEFLYQDTRIIKWMISPGFNESEVDRFVKDLNISEVSIKSLLNDIYLQNSRDIKARFEALLKTKSDKWLVDFYLLLDDEMKDYDLKRTLANVAIVRVNDSTNNTFHVKPASAFLLPPGAEAPTTHTPFIKNEIWNIVNKAQKDSLVHFFTAIGVKEYSELGIIQLELESQKKYPIASEHYKLVARCIKYFKKDPSQSHVLQYKSILATDSEDPLHVTLTEPRELVLDSPYKDTGLAALCTINNQKMLAKGYINYPDISKQDFANFAIMIGVRTELKIEETSSFSEYNVNELYTGFEFKKETAKRIRKDYTIPYLEEYLKKALSIKTSLLIWNALLAAPSSVDTAQYSPNSQADINYYTSTLICILRDYKWIPNKSGSFIRPYDVVLSELHPDFIPNYSNGLLKAIRFGRQEEEKTSKYQEKIEIAKAIGFKDFEEVEKLIKAMRILQSYGVSIDDFLQNAILKNRMATVRTREEL